MEGFGQSERFVEIPWCLSRVRGAQRALDCGYANAEMGWLQGLANLNIPELFGLDLAPPKHMTVNKPDGTTRPLLNPVQGDIRQTPFEADFFDLIFCVSTIEHIGMDNAGYRPGIADSSSGCGDFEAIRELCRITKPGGRLLLTVPFGKLEDHGWFRQYDLNRLTRLSAASDYEPREIHTFRYNNGWKECFAYELNGVGYQTNGAVNAAGLACLEFVKG